MTEAAGPTRRTLLIGAAWSAPVIALAVAAPLAAASGEPADRIRVTVTSVWNPAFRRWNVLLVVTNPRTTPVTVTLAATGWSGATYRSGWSYSGTVNSFLYPLGADESSPAGGLSLSVTAPQDLQPGQVHTITVTVTAATFDPAVVPVPLSY
ncbi:MAG: hypothetical protein Q7T71_00535 [Herbiconiux sp.]|nr:hypothetical protein [Herbiconiux sp.]